MKKTINKTILFFLLINLCVFAMNCKSKVKINKKKLNQDLVNACIKGNLVLVKKLVEQGADIKSISNAPSFYALENGHFEIFRYLKNKGAYISKKSIITASELGRLKFIKYLVKGGANVNIKFSDGTTALLEASRKGHFAVVKYLVEHGADVNAANSNYQTPLTVAIWISGNIKIVRYLLAKGANVNAIGPGGCTPLIEATDSLDCNIDMVKILIKYGAKINFVSPQLGYTPLNRAVVRGCLNIVKYLVAKGVNVNYRNKKGLTALGYAVSSKRYAVARYLRSAGGRK